MTTTIQELTKEIRDDLLPCLIYTSAVDEKVRERIVDRLREIDQLAPPSSAPQPQEPSSAVTPKRYSPHIGTDHHGLTDVAEMREDATGNYVRLADYRTVDEAAIRNALVSAKHLDDGVRRVMALIRAAQNNAALHQGEQQ